MHDSIPGPKAFFLPSTKANDRKNRKDRKKTTAKKGKRRKQPTNLDQKPLEIKRVRVQHDAPPIPDHLARAPPEHAEDEEPGPPAEADGDVSDHGEAEEGEKARVPREGGPVLVYAEGGGAEREGAVGGRAVDDVGAVVGGEGGGGGGGHGGHGGGGREKGVTLRCSGGKGAYWRDGSQGRKCYHVRH